MSIVAAGRTVPIIVQLADLTGPDSDGHAGRQTYIRGGVHHRVVGTLESMTNSTFKPTTDDVLVQGERRVASHFGIGFWADELRIYQYVALENTAYCNGQTARDIEALLSTHPWSIYSAVRKQFGRHVSANEFTYSIEHEDNGKSGNYIVRDEIKQASIALDRLLLSGDGRAIRKAGIRCNDTAAAQLRAIPVNRDTIVDHNVCSPISKPYCWRPIGRDGGFPQDRFIRTLLELPDTDTEGPVGLKFVADVTQDANPWDAIGTGKLKLDPAIRIVRTDDMDLVNLADGADLGVVQLGTLTAVQKIGTDRPVGTRIVLFSHLDRTHAALLDNVAFTSLKDATPYSQKDIDALKATITALEGRIETAKGKARLTVTDAQATVTALGG